MVRSALIVTACFAVACARPASEPSRKELATFEPPASADHPETCPDPYIGRVGGADEAPVVVRKVPPVVTGDQPKGFVVVEAIVDRNGDVCAARILRGLTPEFDEAALEAVKQWKFQPAKLRGHPVQFAFNISLASRAE